MLGCADPLASAAWAVDRPNDGRGEPPFVFAIQGSGKLGARALRREKHIPPSRAARIVTGQRLMQPASDIFLGWITAPNGRQFYVRQLHDAKIKPLVETFDAEMLDAYARRAAGCSLALMQKPARYRQRSPDILFFKQCVRHSNGKIRVGLCGPGRARSCRAQGCSTKGRDCRYQRRLEHDPQKCAMVIRPNPSAQILATRRVPSRSNDAGKGGRPRRRDAAGRSSPPTAAASITARR
jgi:Uncharacterized protein conserved in bacteria (DUF2252)